MDKEEAKQVACEHTTSLHTPRLTKRAKVIVRQSVPRPRNAGLMMTSLRLAPLRTQRRPGVHVPTLKQLQNMLC